MADRKRLLILGGTGEAAGLANLTVGRFSGRLDVIYSLAGRIAPARELAATVRVGGFGGGPGLADFLNGEKIDLLVDATHPFAATISANAYDACLATETPRLILARPPWNLPPRVKCLEADTMTEAARMLSGFAKRVLVTTGQRGLDALAGCPGIHFVIRVIAEPATPPALDSYMLVTGRPPYNLDDEIALMEEHAIDALLAKQSGGEGTVAKITAAIRRHIPIVLLRRPPPEPGESVESVEAALKWLKDRVFP